MATFNFPSGNNNVAFAPISSALNNLPDGAGTIAALINFAAAPAARDFCGLTAPAGNTFTDWFHTLGYENIGGADLGDDDGLVGTSATAPSFGTTDWWLLVVTWAAGGSGAVERYSYVDLSVGTWTHENSGGDNGGNRAGPGTSGGKWTIGYCGDVSSSTLQVALCGAWAGVALSDAEVEALLTNKRTSDWYNNAGGIPTLLVECTSLTPTDIGANPSTFSAVNGTVDLTGGNPTGWTFDGQGSGGGALTISVSDSTSTSETIGRTLAYNVHTSDSTSTSESENANVGVTIAVSDSTSTSEAPTVHIAGGNPAVIVSDSTSTSESVTVKMAANLAVSVSDSPSTSDTIQRTLVSLIAATESLTTSEWVVIAGDPPIAFTLEVDVSDTISSTDTPTVAEALTINVSDSSSISETRTVAEAMQIAVSDSTSSSESLTVSLTAPGTKTVTVNDSTSVSENVTTKMADLHLAVSDSTSTSESIHAVFSTGFVPNIDLPDGLALKANPTFLALAANTATLATKPGTQSLEANPGTGSLAIKPDATTLDISPATAELAIDG